MKTYLPIFLTSLLTVTFSIGPLITVAIRKRLFDTPSEARKIHKRIIPNLGGIAIFSGFLFSLSLFLGMSVIPVANFLLAAGVIIFIIGLKDDIIGVDPMKKFVAQFAAAFIIVVLGDIRFMNLGGLLGIHELSYPFSVGLSVFSIVGVINAFNLVDGIDGLAASLGVLVSLVYATLFYAAGETGWTYVCLALAGSLVGFLIHNISPAKIFMGDCGSLMLGFLISVFSIQFINTGVAKMIEIGNLSIISAPALALSVIILPIFDTLRVFTIRIVHGQSPFKADRNHMHHRMLDLGMNHMQATCTLVGVSALFITVAFVFQDIGSNQLIATQLLIVLLLNSILSVYLYSRKLISSSIEVGEGLAVPAAKPSAKPLAVATKLSVQGKDFAESVLDKVSKN